MQQGDQVYIPIVVAVEDGTIVTPQNCADCRVTILGLDVKSWDGGGGDLIAEQDEQSVYTGRWLYPLSQAESILLGSSSTIQAQVQFVDGTIIGTPVTRLPIMPSLLADVWETGGEA